MYDISCSERYGSLNTLVLVVYEWMFALCCDSHLLKITSPQMGHICCQSNTITALLDFTPYYTSECDTLQTSLTHHSALMSFTHNWRHFNTAQIFGVRLHLIFACTNCFIFVFCFFGALAIWEIIYETWGSWWVNFLLHIHERC